jgi:hypothetical protein
MVLTATFWTPKVKEDNPIPPVQEIENENTRQIVEKTLLAIEKEGFSLWDCRQMGGATICVVDKPDIPPEDLFDDLWENKRRAMTKYPVYTLEELNLLSQVSVWTDRMVLEAKKYAGAIVTRVIERKEAIIIE